MHRADLAAGRRKKIPLAVETQEILGSLFTFPLQVQPSVACLCEQFPTCQPIVEAQFRILHPLTPS
jgi:hypothetical protein